jgi:hypothetical protein
VFVFDNEEREEEGAMSRREIDGEIRRLRKQ